MPNSISAEIEYFFHEGKENLEECMRLAFEAARNRGVQTIVIFTAVGEGPRLAIEKYRSQPEFEDIKIVAVTFPYGQKFTGYEDRPEATQICSEYRQLFKDNGVPVVRAHLPFNPIHAPLKGPSVSGQDMTLIGNALNIFCGSMSLCVQAALMACDAGEVELGEHIISLTSDTAVLVRVAPTERFLADFVVREIVCKPMSLTIIKGEPRLTDTPAQMTIEGLVENDELNVTGTKALKENS
jgi:hypothetical protein